MSGTYTWPQVVNGKTYAQSDFAPYTYATTLPDLLGNFTAQAVSAQGVVQAANASASAAAAATSAAQAASRVAGVTTGSTANLVYPEAVANLATVADVRDVMIYDTRLDSDGGAWRMQCQHTSWYQETLNTATRGAKREFPAVALVVLRQANLTIYDMHDLDGSGVPRMWMVFTGGANNHLYTASGSVPTSVAALNGYIVVTSTGGSGAGRVIRIGFPGDAAIVYSSTNTSRWSGAISVRNSGANVGIFIAAGAIAANDCAQAALRVLPGALRDGAGLAIPTIAVATSGGISVIHPSGLVASLTVASGHRLVSFLSDTYLGGVTEADSAALIYYSIPYATVAESGARVAAYYTSGQSLNYHIGGQPALSADAVGGVLGLAQFAHEMATNPSNGMVAVTGHNFATGWQPGDIRLATLSDARTGTWASDIRLSLDGTSVAQFSPVNSGTLTSTGGRIRIARNTVNNPGGSIGISGLTVGEAYVLDFDAFIGTATSWQVAVNGVGNLVTASGVADALGQRVQFFADQTTVSFVVSALTSTGTNFVEFDNITIRAGVADRSYRARGIHVVGSLSRTAVNTANDLVAVSGFSTSNYLEQTYSSLLDFGTGDFSFAFWNRAASAGGVWMERIDAGAGVGLRLFLISGVLYFDIGASAYSSGLARITSSAYFGDGLWRHVVASRRAGVMELWVDGVLQGTVANVTNLNNASAVFRLGAYVNGTLAANTDSFALLRIAAYAPTHTQIARMFRDEAPLFDRGAKAFIGGTVSWIYDLSQSEHSRRLALSTADGVSIFSGLRRVEYLTTGNLSPAMGANFTNSVALEAGALMVGTSANAGVRREAVTGLDRMLTTPRAPFSPRRLVARGFTTDATPLSLAPRLSIGERETLIVDATVVGRVFGASDGQRIGYQRRATYYRDGAGNVTLQGSVQTIGTDTEVTGTADATLLIDTTAQTVTPQVTGVASTRIVWTATLEITRIADAQYEEIV